MLLPRLVFTRPHYLCTYSARGPPFQIKNLDLEGQNVKNITPIKFYLEIFPTCSWVEHVEVYDRTQRAMKGGVSA